MQISLFFILLSTHTLQNYIGFVWFFNSDHVNNCLVWHSYCFGESCFADFAFKLREVVTNHNIIQLFLDLAVDPVLQAADMNELTRSFALAGVYQWVLFSALIAETDLTRSYQRLLDSMVALVQLKMRSLFKGLGFVIVSSLKYHILHSPKPNNITRGYIISKIYLKGNHLLLILFENL